MLTRTPDPTPPPAPATHQHCAHCGVSIPPFDLDKAQMTDGSYNCDYCRFDFLYGRISQHAPYHTPYDVL